MARILFLTQVLPFPLDSGAKIRQYHMLQHLAKGHQVDLFSFVRDDNLPEHVAALRQIVDQVYTVPIKRSLGRNGRALIKSFWAGLPMVIARDEDREMHALLQRHIPEMRPDIIHADQVSMAQYGLFALAAADRKPKAILDMHNAMYLVLERLACDEKNPGKRWVWRREARAMARYEALVCRTYDAVFTVTHEDRLYLADLYGGKEREGFMARSAAIPISVDPAQTALVGHRDGPPTILHLGTMFWPPNSNGVLWFARQVLPLIHTQMPEVRFVVVGKNPPAQVEALGEDPGIQVTGYVPDPLPYLEQADAFIVPLHAAGGMRVKILDAWLWGLPIIATSIGAEGIWVKNEENIMIADSPHDFAAATLRVLGDRELNHRLRVNGRAWVESNYAWQHVYSQVDHVYARLLG